ncbi:MAG: ATPase [Candidatus Zixiibacteriota bacterium]|nr:MAG: ATPase [candidate division Zixibacteria bacterium]
MKIAIPTVDGILCPHFGHCQQFAVLDIDPENKSINKTEMLTPPAHEPGVLPSWLSQMGCNLIIAGGMGGRAIDMFQQNGVKVVIGAPNGKPEDVVIAYMNGELTTESNPCDEPDFHDNK